MARKTKKVAKAKAKKLTAKTVPRKAGRGR